MASGHLGPHHIVRLLSTRAVRRCSADRLTRPGLGLLGTREVSRRSVLYKVAFTAHQLGSTELDRIELDRWVPGVRVYTCGYFFLFTLTGNWKKCNRHEHPFISFTKNRKTKSCHLANDSIHVVIGPIDLQKMYFVKLKLRHLRDAKTCNKRKAVQDQGRNDKSRWIWIIYVKFKSNASLNLNHLMV